MTNKNTPNLNFASPAHGSRPGPKLSLLLLMTATALTFADSMTGAHELAVFALMLVALFVLIGWSGLRPAARFMLAMSTLAAMVCFGLGVSEKEFALIASRSIYLPALLTVMTLLRVAAQTSPMVKNAGHYVVEQPPSRRFILLALGSHIFGVLLNIGGFLLLLNIATRTVADTAPSPRIAEIQTRRVANAILRGFAATLFWSPLGIAMNLLLPLFPDLNWLEFLPYGLCALVMYIFIGWVFDQFEPRPKGTVAPAHGKGRIKSLMGLLGTLVLIAGAAGLAEAAFDMPLRAAILLIVPAYAVVWVQMTRLEKNLFSSLRRLAADTASQLPKGKSELCVMTASSFVGLALGTIAPEEGVRSLIALSGISNGVLACAVAIIIPIASLIGISPVITATLFVAAITGADIAIPDAMLMLAALTGWGCAVIISPMTATIAIVSGTLNRPATEIGLLWNGPTAAMILTICALGLLIAL